MGARSTEEVRRELASERERLGQAASALRSQAGTVRRKLPLVALGVAGAAVALRLVTKLVRRGR
jgi:glucose-6-phosphate-specific signal transduction histidine kinase